MAVTALGDGRYAVDSESGRSYVVDLPAATCTCPDHEIRGERCKHVRRVALEITLGRVPAPGFHGVECMACGDRAFVPEGAPAVCEDCYVHPGTTVRDRQTGDLLVAVEQTGERADEVRIERDARPGCGDEDATTVADYPNNAGYPDGDPVVYAVYPFSGDADADLADLKRYAFPHSRLAR
jgi:hypothetical protein